jgi:D-glycero-D-manno-heptose 1,7-bisphosphate phosphatase
VLQIGQRYGVRLEQVPIVGDSLRDLQAGVAVGCEPHLVRSGKVARMDEAQLAALLAQVPGARVHDDLAAFVDCMAQREAIEGGQVGGALGRLSG